MSGYEGSNKIKINKIKHDNQGRILIVDADIDIDLFWLTYITQALRRNKLKLIKLKFKIYELDQLLSHFCLDSNKK